MRCRPTSELNKQRHVRIDDSIEEQGLQISKQVSNHLNKLKQISTTGRPASTSRGKEISSSKPSVSVQPRSLRPQSAHSKATERLPATEQPVRQNPPPNQSLMEKDLAVKSINIRLQRLLIETEEIERVKREIKEEQLQQQPKKRAVLSEHIQTISNHHGATAYEMKEEDSQSLRKQIEQLQETILHLDENSLATSQLHQQKKSNTQQDIQEERKKQITQGKQHHKPNYQSLLEIEGTAPNHVFRNFISSVVQEKQTKPQMTNPSPDYLLPTNILSKPDQMKQRVQLFVAGQQNG